MSKISKQLRDNCYVPVGKILLANPKSSTVLRRLYSPSLKIATQTEPLEDEYGFFHSRVLIQPFTFNIQNDFVGLCGYLCEQQSLNNPELVKIDFKFLAGAIISAPYGAGAQLCAFGANPASKLDFSIRGETAGSVWDLCLRAMGLALD